MGKKWGVMESSGVDGDGEFEKEEGCVAVVDGKERGVISEQKV